MVLFLVNSRYIITKVIKEYVGVQGCILVWTLLFNGV
jgi:hypothetical protein